MTSDKFNLSKPQCCTCTLPTVSPCTCPLDFPRPFCHEVLINSCLLKSWGNCIYFSHRSVPLVAKRFIYHFSHRTRNISRVMPQKRQEQEKRLGGFMGYWMMVGGSFWWREGRKGLKAKGQGNNAMQNFWQAWDRKNGCSSSCSSSALATTWLSLLLHQILRLLLLLLLSRSGVVYCRN